MSEHPAGKHRIKVLIGPLAGSIVDVRFDASRTVRVEVGDAVATLPRRDLDSYRKTDIADNPQPGDAYEFLFTPFDGNGKEIVIGSRVYYAKSDEVRRGTVEAFGTRDGFYHRKIKIREDADPRDYDWRKSKGLFTLNEPWNCIVID